MATGDGLLARLRPIGSSLTLGQFTVLAREADRCGNGRIEITQRGSIQVRGLRPDSFLSFAETVFAAMPIETGVPVETPGMAGLAGAVDPRRLAEAVRRALAGVAGVPAKASVVIDDGCGGLAGLAASVVVVPMRPGLWAVDGREMEENAVPAATREALLSATGRSVAGDVQAVTPGWSDPLSGCAVLTVVPAFGGFTAAAAVELAHAATSFGVAELRFGAGRRLHLVLGERQPILASRADALGFVTTLDDPRLDIVACVGRRGCRSGFIDTIDLAVRLAGEGVAPVHVSGCAKGCASRGVAMPSLVGRADGVGILDHGRAGDAPDFVGRTGDAIERLRQGATRLQEAARRGERAR